MRVVDPRIHSACVALLAVLGAGPVLASDGAIELNQAVALAGEVTPGDEPGLPILISRPGRYRFTGNLTLADEFTDGVWIDADDVAIDLGGFQILGPNRCLAIGTPCTLPGPSIGIDTLPGLSGIRISNGAIRGLGSIGVRAGPDSWVHHIRAFDNGTTGIAAGAYSRITDCLAEHNGAGIELVSGRVEANVTRANLGTGIAVLGQADVRGNAASANGGHGIAADFASIVVGNSVRGNGIDGIRSAGYLRANVAEGNARCGMVATNHALLAGNTTSSNGTAGLHFRQGLVGYLANLSTDVTPITGNTGGTGQFTNLGGNLCGACTPTPSPSCDF